MINQFNTLSVIRVMVLRYFQKVIHFKGKNYYKVLEGTDYTNGREGTKAVIYLTADGELCIREKEEFEERFKPEIDV